MTERTLYLLQRLTALILAPCVVAHIVMIALALRGGLTAGEILSRTQGSVGWAIFYSIFVIAAAVHAPIGLRFVLVEWSVLPRRMTNYLMAIFALLLAFAGLRAVIAVVGGVG